MHDEASPIRSFRFGLFDVVIADKTLTRNGVRIKIQDQPYRVLLLLLERAGEVVSREELRRSLWPDGTFVDFDGSLNVILKRLRGAIDDNSENPRFIETVPRQGYRFIAPVAVTREKTQPAFALTPIAASQSEWASSAGPAQSEHLFPWRLIYLAASLILVGGSIAAWLHWRDPKSTAMASSGAGTVPVHLRKSIAVLGFENLSQSNSDAWIGTALVEMLSTELASGEGVRLVSAEDVSNLRAYSPWAKAGTLDRSTTARIGTALSSDLLVLGSYATIGKPEHGQLRVDVRLQDCRTGEVIAEVAEIGATENLFGVVSRVGGKLRTLLGISRSGDSDELLVHTSLPSDPEAARLYSMGLEKLRAYDFELAREFFTQAIAAESKFPFAHAMLSRTDLFLGHFDQAKIEARKGMDLASSLPRVQRMEIEAAYHHAAGERAKAAEIYRVLFSLYPDSLDYGLQLSKLQLESYHADEALDTIHQLRLLPPPVRNEPLIDIYEARIVARKDLDGAEKLYRDAAKKAMEQGKRQVYAKAEQYICFLNRLHLPNLPECREAYNLFTAAGNLDLAGATLQIMAENKRLTGHNAEAIPLYDQAIRTLQEAGDYEGVGVALNNLSLILQNEGQWAKAEEDYRKAKLNFATVNDQINLGVAISNIADIETLRGNFQNASSLYRQSWEIADAAKSPADQSPHLGHASLLLMRGELNDASAEYKTEIASLRSWGGDPWQTANAVAGLGDLQRQQGDFAGARRSYDDAVEMDKAIHSSTAPLQLSLAQLDIDQGYPDLASQELKAVIASFEEDRNAAQELGGYEALCKAQLALGEPADCDAVLDRASKLSDVREFPILGMPLELLRLRAHAARAGQGTRARSALLSVQSGMRALTQRAHHIGFYTLECEARLALADVETKLTPHLAGTHLSTFASEARGRGFAMYAEQAGKIGVTGTQTVAFNQANPRVK